MINTMSIGRNESEMTHKLRWYHFIYSRNFAFWHIISGEKLLFVSYCTRPYSGAIDAMVEYRNNCFFPRVKTLSKIWMDKIGG